MRRLALIFKDNDFQLRPEDELMLCCARTHINEAIEDKIISLVSKDLDWEYLIDMAAKHRLRPLLYVNLNAVCGEDIPEDVLGDLKSFYSKNAQKNLFMLGESLKILKQMYSQNITAIPYKGPFLAISAYDNVILREFGDIDIFVQSNDVPKVKEILLSEGYKTYFNFNNVKENRYVKSQRECKFLNDDTGLNIEIHWKYSKLSFPDNIEFFVGFDNLKKVNIGDLNISSLSDEDLVLVLCLHCASHYWKRLNWLCDINELLKKNDIKWIEILEKAEKWSIKRILLINIILLKNLFGFKFPEYILDEINYDKIAQNISQNLKNNFFKKEYKYTISEEGYLSFKTRENNIYGFKDFFRAAIVPNQSELKNNDHNSFLFFLNYLNRPFKLIKKYEISKKMK